MFESEISILEQLRQNHRLLPVKVSQFYKKKVDEEIAVLGHKNGPLSRIVFPSTEKLYQKQVFESNDYVQDKKNSPKESKGFLIHKYEKTVLFLANTDCLSNCMYCFRQDLLQESKEDFLLQSVSLEEKIITLIEYIQANPQVEEVILSGGDPLMLPAKHIDYIFEELVKHTSIKDFRVHSRNLIFDPKSFTEKHLDVLLKYNVRLVFHIVHPYELCDAVCNKINELRIAGLRLYNQFPILRKINDHVDVLIKLVRQCDELHVRNLSIFFPDPVQYSSAYRINFKRLFDIVDQFNRKTPSWINSTRFCQDSVYGKVRLENLISYNPGEGYALFKRGEQEVIVPDHPNEFDEAGELKNLLWKT